MARTRNIKPGFFQNDQLGELDPIARLTFIGLWTIADFKGCVEYRPKRIKVQLLPYDECDIDQIAINLERAGFIRSYSVQGVRYLKIVNFNKHQNPHKNEREAGSDIPDLDEMDGDEPANINGLADSTDKIGTGTDKVGTDPALSLIPYPSSLTPQPSSLTPHQEPLPPREKVSSGTTPACARGEDF